ncbi:DUF6232 family protein [Krasilnikovia sp. MM14-A1259]|uniref:DUF6232 family protein n=1 Tax=Krasilnikovia sp. MM14-A1259 TaxID=3373539 RepID=UPI00382668A1
MLIGPEAGRGGGRRPQRVVYHASEKIVVTSEFVQAGGCRVPVADLQGTVRCLTSRYPLFRIACLGGGVEVMLAVPFAVAYGSAWMLLAGVVSGLVMAAGAGVDAHRNPRWMTIEAECRGRRIRLLGTTDKKEFTHVRLALIRALEQHRDRVW